MPANHLNPVPAKWGFILRSTGFLVGLYGFGLIVLPNVFSSLFPWSLDVFHSQLYSAIYITGGVMMFSITTLATPAEFVATGLTVATFSTFAILGLFIVDTNVNKIDWAAPNTLIWLVSLAILALLGIAMIVAGVVRFPIKLNNKSMKKMPCKIMLAELD